MFLVSFLFLLFLFSYLFFKFYEHTKVYIPREEMFSFPSDLDVDFEDVNFSSQDQVLLNGWFIEGSLRRVILFCHGNFGNMSSRVDIIKDLSVLGYNVFIFDYRGYGMSNGVSNERGLYLDVLGAYDYLIDKGFEDKDIIVFGRSLGGAVAIFLASFTRGLRGVIIDSTFISARALGHDILGYNLPEFLVSNRFESIKRIKKINIPKLIIHSEEDDLIPFYHGEKLYKEAPEPKLFLSIRGSHDNCISESSDIYVAGIKKFLEGLEP